MQIEPRLDPNLPPSLLEEEHAVDLTRSLVADRVVDAIKLTGLYVKCTLLGALSILFFPVTVPGGILSQKAKTAGMRALGKVMATPVYVALECAQQIIQHSHSKNNLSRAKLSVDIVFKDRDRRDFLFLKTYFESLSTLDQAELGAYIASRNCLDSDEEKFNDLPAKAGRLFYGINAAFQAKAS